MEENIPLVVDLDGTYLKTDSFYELIVLSFRKPRIFFRTVFFLIYRGRANAKAELAGNLALPVESMPLNREVVDFLEVALIEGREIILVTGADKNIAQQFVNDAHPFTRAISSDGETNLTGAKKAKYLVENFGKSGFDYIGNARADEAVWKASRKRYLATASQAIPMFARQLEFDAVFRGQRERAIHAWIKEIRPHQSLKNVLLFLPLLASHNFSSLDLWLRALAGFIIFSLMASSVYLLNDALDLESDRKHAKKSRRPLAAGDVSVQHALLLSLCLSLGAIISSIFLGHTFTLLLIVYAATTVAYSFWLKRIALVDVLVLTLLYMLRIFAGAVLVSVPLTFWFTAVSAFLFLSLAFAKRFTEIASETSGRKTIPGRGYHATDSLMLAILGVGSGIGSVIFLASYIQSTEVLIMYESHQILWLVVPVFFYWVANIWLTAGRGEMHNDPVVFALRNKASIASALLAASLFFIASQAVLR